MIINNGRTNSLLHVFLCHSSDDKPIVRDLYQQLQLSNVDPWLDEEKLLPGQDWKEEVRKTIMNSDAIIVCLSNKAITKAGFIHKEIKYALDVADEQPEETIFIIPLKLQQCNIPDKISQWHYVNLFENKGYAKFIRALQVRAKQIGVVKPKLFADFNSPLYLKNRSFDNQHHEISFSEEKKKKPEFHTTLWNVYKIVLFFVSIIVSYIGFNTISEGYSLEVTDRAFNKNIIHIYLKQLQCF
ncbi:MAG: toll/interleukin-1 receptor domain-containing protein [Desulfobacterales bacterium]|nr:toll/interleukin-1 receptor domain-containing protein [Desulfobacterales bacterium]